MLFEGFVASIRAHPKSANTAVAKDVGIYVQNLHPNLSTQTTFKKSSTAPNCLAVSSTHVFAAQVDKAVIHVYSRERGNQESLVSFPERLSSLILIDDGVLAIGTAEGRLILWEVFTGRQVVSPAAHLQPVSCIAASNFHVITGSADSNINVWSLPRLLSLDLKESPQRLRTLSNHRAAVTSIVIGQSSSLFNICVSASTDKTILIWNYQSGDLLKTFLLPTAPLCLALDPCERAVFAGFENGTLILVEFFSSPVIINPLYDSSLQKAPVQIDGPAWNTPTGFGSALCLGVSYDATTIFSGHENGKIAQWDAGRRTFSSEVADLNAPVTNLSMLRPFAEDRNVKAVTIVKPKLGDGNYTFAAKLTSSLETQNFDDTLNTFGLPSGMIEQAILDLSYPASPSSIEDQKLRQENDDLWNLVHEQRVLQRQTWEKYSTMKSGRL